MSKKIIMLIFIAAFMISFFPLENANAIPAFARKYKFSCTTCHMAAPKLKAYGDDFAGNGFLIPDGEEPRRAYVNTGDDQLLLMRDLPLAVRLDAYFQVADRDNAKTDLQAPYGIKLLSGGPISKSVSYYFYFYVSERGEVAGVEDAILHFNNIAGTELDIGLGQFQISDPLFKRELRLTYEDYMIYRHRTGNSQSNLTYDRGIIFSYGLDFGLDASAMIMNGNGIGDAGADRLFDMDSFKTYAFRAIQGIGDFNIGAFVYSNAEKLSPNNEVNNIMMYGPDFTYGTDKFEFNVQYLMREDDNPMFNSVNDKMKSEGGFAEIVFMPEGDQSRFVYTILYNSIQSDMDVEDYETATFSISHMAARNLRISGEYTFDLLDEKQRFTVGAMAAF